MLHLGGNFVDGIPVEVTRKRVRRINIRVAGDGTVRVSLPAYGVTLAETREFLMSKWRWVLDARRDTLARCRAESAAPDKAQIDSLRALLVDLNRKWMARTGEKPFAIRLRRMKSLWGSCHWVKRRITYNTELARHPPETVEYVVVHEITHFSVHDHGERFKALMDERLPQWRTLRARLKKSP